ncbi:MAG: dTDP-4-dehydrorhamnose 3,5-epimerase family protein [Thermoanaerobaculia bacterium]
MKFVRLGIPGAFLVLSEPLADDRGFFARTFCAREFAAAGLESRLVQTSLSFNPQRGTLRGLHYQASPHDEAKLVRCVRGTIYDILVDLRPESHIFRQHLALELSADERSALYVPPGVAHGFLTLTPDCEVHYAMSEFFEPASSRGVRWNDPAFGIVLPEPVRMISDRDANYPDLLPPLHPSPSPPASKAT